MANKHVVIDVETTNTDKSPESLMSIGIVVIDLDMEQSIDQLRENSFHAKFGLNEGNLKAASVGTMSWWMRQSKDAITRVLQADEEYSDLTHEYAVTAALVSLEQFLEKQGRINGVWGNGSDFDNEILTRAYNELLKKDPPWAYYQNRCLRTLRKLSGIKEVEVDCLVKHDAVDDAIYEALQLREIKQMFPTLSI